MKEREEKPIKQKEIGMQLILWRGKNILFGSQIGKIIIPSSINTLVVSHSCNLMKTLFPSLLGMDSASAPHNLNSSWVANSDGAKG